MALAFMFVAYAIVLFLTLLACLVIDETGYPALASNIAESLIILGFSIAAVLLGIVLMSAKPEQPPVVHDTNTYESIQE